MKYKAIMMILCILLTGCNIYKKENGIKPKNTKIILKKFDIKNFKKHSKGKKECEIVQGDSIFKRTEYNDSFYEEAKKINGKFKTVYNYYKESLIIKSTGKFFGDMPFAVAKFYNEKGEIIKEINYDKNYPFSVYDLIAKIKTTHQMDLNDPKENIDVNKTIDKKTGNYIYEILYNGKNNGSYKYITVDGITGQIFSEGNGYTVP